MSLFLQPIAAKGIAPLLDRSLDRMKTDYVDLCFIHGGTNIDELSGDTRRWTEKAKAAGKIKLFGFSTHRNMDVPLMQAPKPGYVDGIMKSQAERHQ